MKTSAQKRLAALQKKYHADMKAIVARFRVRRAKLVIARLREQGVERASFVFSTPHLFDCVACGHTAHFDHETGEPASCSYSSCERGCCNACSCSTLSVRTA